LDPCLYDIFDSESALELNPEVVILTSGTPVYIYIYIYMYSEINMIIIINNKQRIGKINRKMFFHVHEETQRVMGSIEYKQAWLKMCKEIVL